MAPVTCSPRCSRRTVVGVDLSPAIVAAARARHSQLAFEVGDAHDLSSIEGPFDVVILSDLLNDLWDVQAVFGQVARLSHPGTRLIVNNYSRLWELPLGRGAMAAAGPAETASELADRRGRLEPDVPGELRSGEGLGGSAVARVDARHRRRREPVPGQALAVQPPRAHQLHRRAAAAPDPVAPSALRVSVVVPARNEAGNIEQIFARTPEMGAGTELIFVEGHSKDDTYQAIEAAIARHPERSTQLFRQEGVGKGDAVRLGFAQGDRRRPDDSGCRPHRAPEDLPRFFDALRSGDADFVNGVRLVYPMEKEAMRFCNLLGNKFFSLAFSWLLGQSIKDTLCGTKVLSRANYERIAANRAYFGDFDPFGDFDLLFGAARLSLRIVDLPIRYRERTYGTTNIQRWRHGWLLLRMLLFAARRLKFV